MKLISFLEILIKKKSNLRRGIEKEFWVVDKTNNTAFNIKKDKKFCTLLSNLGGALEYQCNLFELRTLPGKEESSLEEAEYVMQKKIQLLTSYFENNYSNTRVYCCGTYQGEDDPSLDVSQNESEMGQNAFWNEFSIVYPGDTLARYTAADHLNVSISNANEQTHIDLYNCLMGLSPLFVYAFSTSPCIQGKVVTAWNRRQQLIDAMGIQSNICIPGAYPLTNIKQYQVAFATVIQIAEKNLLEKNPFFSQVNMTPSQIIGKYRGSDWDFLKLFTNQVVRFNQQSGSPAYLEVRCVDAQECIKMTISCAYFIKKAFAVYDEIKTMLPCSEIELRHNVREVIYKGENAQIIINNGKKIPITTYTKKLIDIILSQKNNRYEQLLRKRFLFPVAKTICQYMKKNKNITGILSECLIKNMTIEELL